MGLPGHAVSPYCFHLILVRRSFSDTDAGLSPFSIRTFDLFRCRYSEVRTGPSSAVFNDRMTLTIIEVKCGKDWVERVPGHEATR